MKIYVWEDRREPTAPRVVMQNGDCKSGVCRLWSVSISDGLHGMTARFDTKEEFELFLKLGEATEVRDARDCHGA